jgi:hypothetical protein
MDLLLLPVIATKGRPVLSPERTSHKGKTATVNWEIISGQKLQRGHDIKIV